MHDGDGCPLPQEDINYSFLWMRDDYQELMARVVEQIYKLEQNRTTFRYTYLENFFVEKNAKDHHEVKEKQDCFLKDLIERRHEDPDFMKFVFSVIAHFHPDRRRQFVALFLEHNKSFEVFQGLPFEPNVWGWTGSAVPMLQKRAEYFESLLPLLNTVDLLQHKQCVEKQIQRIRSEYIEREKKRAFMED